MVSQQCDLDAVGGGGDRFIETSGNQLLVVLFNGLQDNAREFTIELDDGSARTAPVQLDPSIGWGIARFEIPADQTMVGVGVGSAPVTPLTAFS